MTQQAVQQGVPAGHPSQENAALHNGAAGKAVTAVNGVLPVKVDGQYNKLRLTLRDPIVHDGRTYREFTFREVNLGDVTILQEEGEGPIALSKIFSNMTNKEVPADVFLQLPAKEMALVVGFFTGCMQGLRAPG